MPEPTPTRRRLVTAVGLALGALYLFANSGFWNLVNRMGEQRRLRRVLARLRADHEALTREWARMEHDPAYSEYLIRKNLGYVKKGEVEYDILKKDK